MDSAVHRGDGARCASAPCVALEGTCDRGARALVDVHVAEPIRVADVDDASPPEEPMARKLARMRRVLRSILACRPRLARRALAPPRRQVGHRREPRSVCITASRECARERHGDAGLRTLLRTRWELRGLELGVTDAKVVVAAAWRDEESPCRPPRRGLVRRTECAATALWVHASMHPARCAPLAARGGPTRVRAPGTSG